MGLKVSAAMTATILSIRIASSLVQLAVKMSWCAGNRITAAARPFHVLFFCVRVRQK
jgi:hypothetical protein